MSNYFDSYDEESNKNYEISLFQFPKNFHEKINDSINVNFSFKNSHGEDDESYFEKTPQQDLELNIKPKFQLEFSFGDYSDKKTKPNTQTKTQKEKTEEIEIKRNEFPEFTNQYHLNFDINNIIPINNNNEIIIKENEAEPKSFLNKKTNRGRKKKDEKDLDDSRHGKDSEDNIMRKIKTHLVDQIVILLNKSLNDKEKKFLKIDKTINENLKRDFNMQLMEKTIKTIFTETKISSKYKKNDDIYYNKKLIQKIFDEKTEYNTINLLQKKFIEMLRFIRENNLKEFLDSIQKKESKNPNNQEYINSIKGLFFRYEDWFSDKKGRNREKKTYDEIGI